MLKPEVFRKTLKTLRDSVKTVYKHDDIKILRVIYETQAVNQFAAADDPC